MKSTKKMQESEESLEIVTTTLEFREKKFKDFNQLERDYVNEIVNSHYTADQTLITATKQTKRKCRAKLDDFLFKKPSKMKDDKHQKSEHSEEHGDLLIPMKKPKKAPTNASNRKRSKSKASYSRSKKSQISIKSAFCFANVSTRLASNEDLENEELQLALNLSKIEFENAKENIDCDNDCSNEKDGIKNIEAIQDQLKMYGFRKATKQDYELVANNFKPKIINKSRKSFAWTNKYTALTLRNSEEQHRKLTEKIQSTINIGLLSMDVKYDPNSKAKQSRNGEIKEYQLISSILLKVKCQYFNICKHREEQELSAYFASDLFPIRLDRKYSLLKDWSKIPGRSDISPIPSKYKEQESTGEFPLKQDTSKKITINLNTQINIEFLQNNENLNETIETPTKIEENEVEIKRKYSPDLFADTDEDDSAVDGAEDLLEVNLQDIAMEYDCNNIEKHKILNKSNTVVDLTQEDSNTMEGDELMVDKNNSLRVICNEGQTVDAVRRGTIEIDDSSDKDDEIFKQLYNRYLPPTLHQLNNQKEEGRYEGIHSNSSNIGTEMELQNKICAVNDSNESTSSNYSNRNDSNSNEFVLSEDEINYSIRKTHLIASSLLSKHGVVDDKNFDKIITRTSAKRRLDLEFEEQFIENNTNDNCSSFSKDISSSQSQSKVFHCLNERPSNDITSQNNLENSKVINEVRIQNLSSSYSESEDEFDRLVLNNKRELDNYSLSAKVYTEMEETTASTINNNLVVSAQKSRINRLSIENARMNVAQSCSNKLTPVKSSLPGSYNDSNNTFEEVVVDGRTYLVRYSDSPKPDFATLDDNEIVKHLHKYGLKKLKRCLAIKMLEYIYNQTHPFIEEDDEVQSSEEDSGAEPELNSKQLTAQIANIVIDKRTITLNNNVSGADILQYSDELQFEFQNEDYIFQTNVTKKTLRPLLPLHLAWYNLICSNPALHEIVLMYEPIDLQDIYLYWKTMGYRYNPKDLKTFFDKRSIIFRYDVPTASSINQRR